MPYNEVIVNAATSHEIYSNGLANLGKNIEWYFGMDGASRGDI